MKNKPTYSIINNIFWVFSNQFKYAKTSFFLLLLIIPLTILNKFLLIYLPKKVVADVIAGIPYSQILKSLAFIIMSIFLSDTFINATNTLNFAFFCRLRQKMQYKLTLKNVSVNYQIIESLKYREMYSRAQRALWANGMHCPLTQISQSFAELITNVIGYCFYAALICMLNPWIVVILTATSFISLYFTKIYQNYEYKNRDKRTVIDKKIWYLLNKSSDFKIAKDIRVFGLDKWLSKLYKSLCKERMNWNKKLLYKKFLSSLADLVIILFRDGFAYYILISMVLEQKTSVDNFILYFGIISSFATWIGNIIENCNEIYSSGLVVSDLRDVLSWDDGNAVDKGIINLPQKEIDGDIKIENLYFKHENSNEFNIQDVNLHIKKGEKIAIVGENGAGKTTLIKIICGLYTPVSGEIKIDDISSRCFEQKDYFEFFSVMFQDMNILCVTIAEIISSKTGEDINIDLVWNCIKKVGLYEKIIGLPNDINTPLNKQVYDNGTEFSGGEMQKLILAKALYKNSPILILDEPTSAMDPIAELRMYKDFNKLVLNKTTIFISHRLASTKFCDRIIFMDKGQIVEEGTHSELVQKGGRYAKMFEIQSHYYKENGGVKQ